MWLISVPDSNSSRGPRKCDKRPVVCRIETYPLDNLTGMEVVFVSVCVWLRNVNDTNPTSPTNSSILTVWECPISRECGWSESLMIQVASFFYNIVKIQIPNSIGNEQLEVFIWMPWQMHPCKKNKNNMYLISDSMSLWKIPYLMTLHEKCIFCSSRRCPTLQL